MVMTYEYMIVINLHIKRMKSKNKKSKYPSKYPTDKLELLYLLKKYEQMHASLHPNN